MALTLHRTDTIPFEIEKDRGLVFGEKIITDFEKLKTQMLLGPETGLRMAGESVVILDVDVLQKLMHAIAKEVGDVFTNKILYTCAEMVGYEFARTAIETHKIEDIHVLEKFLGYFMSRGIIGHFNIRKLDLKSAETRVDVDWTIFSAHNILESGGKPVDHFIRGGIAGVMRYLTDKPIYCRETQCVAKGDLTCRFII